METPVAIDPPAESSSTWRLKGGHPKRLQWRGEVRASRNATTREIRCTPTAASRRPSAVGGHNARVPAIALIDGEHHPRAVRDALDRLARARAGRRGLLRRRGEARAGLARRALRASGGDGPARRRSGGWRPTRTPWWTWRTSPCSRPSASCALAALALHLGLRYEAPGVRLDPPRYEPVGFDGPKLAVIGTGKRTGKTARGRPLGARSCASRRWIP